jgi:hypothetical protein
MRTVKRASEMKLVQELDEDMGREEVASGWSQIFEKACGAKRFCGEGE